MNFRYKARSADGRIVEGVIKDVGTQTEAVNRLRLLKMLPITVTEAKGGHLSSSSLYARMRLIATIPLKDKALFFRQVTTMVAAGVPLGSSLDLLSRQISNPRLADAVTFVKQRVDGGQSFSGAMRLRREFSPLMIAVVRAGEEGGVLDRSLDRLATFLERQDALKRKVISAVSYPAVVFGFALFVLYLLVTVVVPRFSTVFDSLNVELPALTRHTFRAALWFRRYWYVPLAAVGALVGLVVAMGRNDGTRYYVDKAKLKLPVFGDLILKSSIARSHRTLASLVESGVPILQALAMTADTAGNIVIERAFRTIEEGARKGIAIGELTRRQKIFPQMVGHMITVGEQTGRLEEMVDKVADWFELELDEKVKRLTSILEPLLIIFVGAVVAAVALAVFLPIVSAIQTMI